MPAPEPSVSPAGGSALAALDLIQSFTNTVDLGSGADLLRTRDDAATWLRAAALLPADAGLTNSEHAALLRLRAAVRDALAAHAAGTADDAAAARLTRALADGRLVVTADEASAVRLASAARASYPNLVATIAIAIASADAAGTWRRLRACARPGCGRAFYHESAPGTPSAVTRCPAHAGGR